MWCKAFHGYENQKEKQAFEQQGLSYGFKFEKGFDKPNVLEYDSRLIYYPKLSKYD